MWRYAGPVPGQEGVSPQRGTLYIPGEPIPVATHLFASTFGDVRGPFRLQPDS